MENHEVVSAIRKRTIFINIVLLITILILLGTFFLKKDDLLSGKSFIKSLIAFIIMAIIIQAGVMLFRIHFKRHEIPEEQQLILSYAPWLTWIIFLLAGKFLSYSTYTIVAIIISLVLVGVLALAGNYFMNAFLRFDLLYNWIYRIEDLERSYSDNARNWNIFSSEYNKFTGDIKAIGKYFKPIKEDHLEKLPDSIRGPRFKREGFRYLFIDECKFSEYQKQCFRFENQVIKQGREIDEKNGIMVLQSMKLSKMVKEAKRTIDRIEDEKIPEKIRNALTYEDAEDVYKTIKKEHKKVKNIRREIDYE